LRLVIDKARIYMYSVIACLLFIAPLAITEAYGASRADRWEPEVEVASNQRMRIVTGEIEELSGWQIKVRGEQFNIYGAKLHDTRGEPFPMERLAESALVRLNLWDGEVISVVIIIGEPQ